ncbi:MAG: excinuclease ABC subunit UvrC [Clostridia bacterium]|nr:excinuclease ABC subunit UvrC [Clostridia bacterium]
MTIIERLRDKANSLPETPGVYIMKNTDGEIIYVGKSKKLKNRVTSYFTGNNHTPKTARMVSLVRDFDYIVCDTEIEALALENVLIKKHSPKYNIKLKDAKSYPYIKVTAEEYPRLFVTRERKSDKARYFGPYQGSSAAHTALETVVKIFGLYTCRRSFPKDIGKERPCIYKDMGRCVAPCVGGISGEEYRALVKCAEWVLDGNIKATVDSLTRDMEYAAEEMEFERAAQLRDSIRALGALVEKQKVVADEKVMRDVFAVYIGETESVLAMLSIRGGALVNKNQFVLSLADFSSEDDAVALIADYYDTAGNIPREIMLDFELTEEDRSLLSEYLTLSAPYKVTVKVPSRGDGRRLCDMALENAKETARQHRLTVEREDKSVGRLAELLGLSEVPRRIEAYDISNFGNESIFASMVVFADGKLKKSDYRAFSIKTTLGQDDYGSMREALARRVSHIGDGTASLGETPDLILLDGGEGHVGMIKELFSELDIDIPVYGMVKDDFHKTRAITDGDEEISIAREMNVYTFIYNLQEEAHRFALKHSTRDKSKKLTNSTLTRIPGIGEKKAKLLLSSMPYVKIKAASVAELVKIKGISQKDAESIREYFDKKEK